MENIHAKRPNGEIVLGSLNIGHLEPTLNMPFNKEKIYKNEKGEIFICTEKMRQRINERILILKKDQ